MPPHARKGWADPKARPPLPDGAGWLAWRHARDEPIGRLTSGAFGSRRSSDRRRGRPDRPHRPGRRAASLEGDGGAGALEGGLGLVRGLLVDLLQDRLRSGVHEVLGLLESEARERAHLLDDLDLLVAG